MTFSTSVMKSAAGDAAALAAWRQGQDPLLVVQPLAIAAAWAYADQQVFDEVMARRGLRGLPSRFLEVVNDAMFVCARAYVQPVAGGAILSFRGTEPTDLINWLADASMEKAAFHAEPPGAPHGYVHGGFYRNLRAIWPRVVEALDELKPEWIYVTGHSFGAALAALAGALLVDYQGRSDGYASLWGKVRGIFTFGQPMVGDQAFADAYRDSVGGKLVRFVYAHDIVPHLPPATSWEPVPFGAEYRSAGAPPWAVSAGLSEPVRHALTANLGAVLSWMKVQSGLLPNLQLPYSWGDHAPNNYVRVSLPHGADSGSEFD